MKTPCYADGCDRDSRSAGLCAMHYQRFQKYGNPNLMSRGRWFNLDGSRKLCSVEGCTLEIKVIGLCSVHANRKYKTGSVEPKAREWKICPTPGCGREMVYRNNLCGKCNQDAWRYSLSDDRFLELMDPENRRCQNRGCGRTENLHLDHDHSCPCHSEPGRKKSKVSCGECVRGWLCRHCNLAEGYLKADPDRILGLLEYLQRHGSVTK